ncbi:hypothetical+protein [Methylocapsa aurea]|jgi:hypothetical protein
MNKPVAQKRPRSGDDELVSKRNGAAITFPFED